MDSDFSDLVGDPAWYSVDIFVAGGCFNSCAVEVRRVDAAAAVLSTAPGAGPQQLRETAACRRVGTHSFVTSMQSRLSGTAFFYLRLVEFQRSLASGLIGIVKRVAQTRVTRELISALDGQPAGLASD